MQYLNVTQVVSKSRRLKFVYWSDENHICRKLEYFVIIFYAKYSMGNSGFTFWIETVDEDTFIVAENISKFQYRFPLSK